MCLCKRQLIENQFAEIKVLSKVKIFLKNAIHTFYNAYLKAKFFHVLFLGRVDEKAAQLHAIASLQNILHKSGGGPAPPSGMNGASVPEV